MFWSLVNMLIPLAIVLLIIWYLKKLNDKLDILITLLQSINKADQDHKID